MISNFTDPFGNQWQVLESLEYEPPGSRQGTTRLGYLCDRVGKDFKLIFDASHYFIHPEKEPPVAEVVDANYTHPHFFLIVKSGVWEIIATREEFFCLISGIKVPFDVLTPEQMHSFCRIIGAIYRSTCGLVYKLGFWQKLSPENQQLIVDIGYATCTKEAPKPPKPIRCAERCKFVQLDTYRAANSKVKEQLEAALEKEVVVNQEWYELITEEWEGHYPDFGPPVHTWFLTDKSEEEILAIARQIDPHAEIAQISDEWITEEFHAQGITTSYRPDRYLDIDIDEDELLRRLDIDASSFFFSYGLRGWHTWQVERVRARRKEIEWTPEFPTKLQFPQEKLEKLFQNVEILENIWDWGLEVPSKQNMMAMIGYEELVQIARYEFEIEEELPEHAEELLDYMLPI